jgi:hypothetical protein
MVADNVKRTMVDLSGRAIEKNGMPRSGVYLVQKAKDRGVDKIFDFGNNR